MCAVPPMSGLPCARPGMAPSSATSDDPAGPVLAVAMASAAPGDAADGLLALNRARTLDEAGAASARIVAPVQNLLVADRDGIGQFTTGRIPLRRAGDGALPVAGADGLHDWTGFAIGEQTAAHRSPRPRGGSSTPMSAWRRPVFRCSWGRTGSAIGALAASGRGWMRCRHTAWPGSPPCKLT